MGDVFSQNNQIVLLQIFIFIVHHYFNSFWYYNTHTCTHTLTFLDMTYSVPLIERSILLPAVYRQQWPCTAVTSEGEGGAYLLCLRVSCMGKGHDYCQPELRRVRSSAHPKELTYRNESFNRQGMFTLLNMCQWKGIITVTERLIKMTNWV